MDSLITSLQRDFPQFAIIEGDAFYWSSSTKEIFYTPGGSTASLLHELGHATLNHRAFKTDMELLSKEVAAWEKARELALIYRVSFDEHVVEQCIDTYRDWLYTRSSCPTCNRHGVQQARSLYVCLNCGDHWKVSASMLCRAYRQRQVTLNAK